MAEDEALKQPDDIEPEDTDVESTEAATEADEESSEMAELKEKLDVATEDVGPLRKRVTITVPREIIDEKLEKQYGDLRRDAIVPGFRKGRAPRRLLEKRFGHDVSETITSELLGTGYMAAIEKVGLKVLGDPLVWCKPKKPAAGESADERLMSVRDAFDNMELPDDGPLVYACEVEIQPEFELPSLEGIPVKKTKVEITDAHVDQQIDRLRGMRGAYEPVTDRGVETDDRIEASVRMLVDGSVVKEQDHARLYARPQTVDGIAMENLGDELSGAKPGDVRRIKATVPDDDDRTELRGKAVEFEITIRDISRLVLPELTKEMIEPFGFESIDDFRKYVRADLETRATEMIRRSMRGQVYDYLLTNTQIDLPERLSQRQAARAALRRMVDLYRQGVPEAEVAKHMDELRTVAQNESVRELKVQFIMDRIAEKFETAVSEDEINGQIAMIAQQQNRRFDRVRDELIRDDGITSLYMQLRDEKIVDQLLEKAVVTEDDAPAPAAPNKGKSRGGKRSTKAQKTDEFADET